MTFKDFLDVFLFISLCFLTLGALSLSFSEKAYKAFYENYVLYPDQIFYWGLGAFVITLVYGLTLYTSSKGSFLFFKMSSGPLAIDRKLLKELIDHTTNKNFSDLNIESEVEITEDQTLAITAASDPIDFKKQELILKKLEKEIAKELLHTLAYKKPFFFNLKMR